LSSPRCASTTFSKAFGLSQQQATRTVSGLVTKFGSESVTITAVENGKRMTRTYSTGANVPLNEVPPGGMQPISKMMYMDVSSGGLKLFSWVRECQP
jgi:hypothetical protein